MSGRESCLCHCGHGLLDHYRPRRSPRRPCGHILSKPGELWRVCECRTFADASCILQCSKGHEDHDERMPGTRCGAPLTYDRLHGSTYCNAKLRFAYRRKPIAPGVL